MADNFYASYGGGGGSGAGVVSVVKVTKTYADFSTAAQTNTLALYTIPAGMLVQYLLTNVTTAFSGAGITTGDLFEDVGGGQQNTVDPSILAVNPAVAAAGYLVNFTTTTPATVTLTTTIGNLNGLTAGSADIYIILNDLSA